LWILAAELRINKILKLKENCVNSRKCVALYDEVLNKVKTERQIYTK